MSQLLSKKIIAWYQKHKRSLPWRTHRNTKDRDYKVLISEFMLQQTKVSTVIPYFNKFYKKFPNINSLAKARITSVLKLWEGLGYYRRARNLHLTSKILNKDFDSSLPADINQLKNLPGIGDYTASAIMAIAKNKSFIGIDGNVKRVLSRIFAIQQNKDFIKNIEKKIITMKVSKHCSDLMQGIMEIGALLCRPKKPDCQKCPIQKYCKFSFRPNAEIIPSRKIKEKHFYAFFIEKKKSNSIFI